jgi:hypothetical protein
MNQANDHDQLSVATSARPRASTLATPIYRDLVARGLEASEAANLTAFFNGLAVVDQPWTINELSHVIFLRELCRSGRFGRNDGARSRQPAP